MVSQHFVYQIVLFALIWLFVILHLTQSKRPVTAPATPTEPRVFCPLPRICSAAHIRGYAEFRNMRSILPLDGSNSLKIKQFFRRTT